VLSFKPPFNYLPNSSALGLESMLDPSALGLITMLKQQKNELESVNFNLFYFSLVH